MTMAVETAYDPFTCDGVQAVSAYVEGWTAVSMPEVFSTVREARRWVEGQCDYWTRYSDRLEFTYWGYDPCVYDDGEAFGTDGYPDAIGTYDDDTEVVTWERA